MAVADRRRALERGRGPRDARVPATLAIEDRARFLPDGDIQSISSASEVQELAVTLAHLDLKASQSRDSAALHEAALVFAAAG